MERGSAARAQGGRTRCFLCLEEEATAENRDQDDRIEGKLHIAAPQDCEPTLDDHPAVPNSSGLVEFRGGLERASGGRLVEEDGENFEMSPAESPRERRRPSCYQVDSSRLTPRLGDRARCPFSARPTIDPRTRVRLTGTLRRRVDARILAALEQNTRAAGAEKWLGTPPVEFASSRHQGCRGSALKASRRIDG